MFFVGCFVLFVLVVFLFVGCFVLFVGSLGHLTMEHNGKPWKTMEDNGKNGKLWLGTVGQACL